MQRILAAARRRTADRADAETVRDAGADLAVTASAHEDREPGAAEEIAVKDEVLVPHGADERLAAAHPVEQVAKLKGDAGRADKAPQNEGRDAPRDGHAKVKPEVTGTGHGARGYQLFALPYRSACSRLLKSSVHTDTFGGTSMTWATSFSCGRSKRAASAVTSTKSVEEYKWYSISSGW